MSEKEVPESTSKRIEWLKTKEGLRIIRESDEESKKRTRGFRKDTECEPEELKRHMTI